jgi:hypothetical protein
MRSMKRVLIATTLTLAAGCDGPDSGDDGEQTSRCAAEDRDEPFTIGMSVPAEGLALRVVDADPAVPVRGDNHWMLELEVADTATPGAVIDMTSWMPDHGHGSPKPAVITDEGDGTYAIDPVNLFMAGYWEVTFAVTMPETELAQDVVFKLCVE